MDHFSNIPSNEQLKTKNTLQEQNLTPEAILADIDENSEYYQQAKEEYDEFQKHKNETFAEQIASSKLALQDLRMEFQQDIQAIKKMGTLFANFEIEGKQNVVKEKFSEVFANNESLEESFFTLIDTQGIEAVRAYIESKLTNPRRINERGITRMIDSFQGDGPSQFEKEINGLISQAQSLPDLDYIRQKIIQLPEENRKEYKDVFIDLEKKLQAEQKNTTIEQKNTTIEQKNTTIEQKNVTIEAEMADLMLNEEVREKTIELWLGVQNDLKGKIDFDNIDENLYVDYSELLIVIQNFSEEKNLGIHAIDTFRKYLKENNSQFQNFLIDLGKTDIDQYEAFYNVFQKIPEFSSFMANLESPKKLRELQQEKSHESISIYQIYAESYLGPDAKRLGDKMYSEDKMVDLGEFPPKYYLVGKNGFKLETTVPISSELEKSRKEYFAMQVTYHQELNQQNDRLEFIQQQIAIKKEAGIDTSDLEFQKDEVLSQIEKIKNDFEKLASSYSILIKEELDKHKTKMEEKEKVAGQVNKFANNIGLVLIHPQSKLDELFKELQVNSLKVPGLDLNPKNIDLANGRFGESDLEQGTDKWQINLIKFLNKMITGNIDEPHNIQQFVSVGGATIDPTTFKLELLKGGVINNMGEAQIDKIRKNLKSTGLDTQNKVENEK